MQIAFDFFCVKDVTLIALNSKFLVICKNLWINSFKNQLRQNPMQENRLFPGRKMSIYKIYTRSL